MGERGRKKKSRSQRSKTQTTPQLPFCISFTGIYGNDRLRGQEIIQRLHGVYSGNFDTSRVTHLVVNVGPQSPLAAHVYTEKLQLALEKNIPIISFQWLLESSKAGKFLDSKRFRAGPSVCLSTAASCTGGSAAHLDLPSVQKSRKMHAENDGEENNSILRNFELDGLSRIDEIPGESNHDTTTSPVPNLMHSKLLDLYNAGKITTKELSAAEAMLLISPTDLKALEENASPSLPPLHTNALYDITTVSANQIPGQEKALDVVTNRDTSLHPRKSYLSYSPKSGDLLQSSHPVTDACSSSSSSQLRPSVAALSSPPYSVVTLGSIMDYMPSRNLFKSFKAHHGSLKKGDLTFYTSANVETNFGTTIQFSAKQMVHGATILYDIDPNDGQKTYAKALVRLIYTLKQDKEEVYMLHHYLLDAADVADRPAWHKALHGDEIGDGELLLSAQPYHSPMHLIVGDFGLYLYESAPVNHSSQHKTDFSISSLNEPDAISLRYFPVFECRRALDASNKSILPLAKVARDISS